MRLARACWALFTLSFRRLVWSTNTLMLLLPLAGCALFVIGMKYAELPSERMAQRSLGDAKRQVDEAKKVAQLAREVIAGETTIDQIRKDQPVDRPFRAGDVDRLAKRAFERFSGELVFGLFASFILPVIAIAYATTSLGGDREDRTLLFLLVRPIPRPAILLAKTAATVPVVLGAAVGSYYLYCWLAGPLGARAFPIYLPVVVYTSLAYTGLFHLFAVCFRHSTIVALIYALFIETFLGNMPGIVKQVAVNYYGRSMMIELGGLKPPEAWFVPVSAHTGVLALAAIAGGSLLAGVLLFQWREYRDLT